MSLDLVTALTRWLQPASLPAAASLVLALLLANILLSTLLAVLVHRLLPQRLRGRAARNILALATLGSVLPLLGPLLLLAIGLAYPYLEKGPQSPQPKVVLQPTFATEIRGHFSHFGAGGALARLRTAAPDSEQGSRALLAIAARRSRETTHLLSEALSHPDETLRLLAYNLLARREEAIVAHMSRLEEHRRAHGPGAAQITLDLAELHLEFLYLGIASGSLRRMHLDAAQRLIETIGEPPADAPWRSRLLLVRARLSQQRTPAAGHADVARDYELASAAGAAPARALPWLLESAWRARDYSRLRRLLEQHRLYRHIPLIGPVAALWGYALDA
jgi:polysaccharide biosynthesis protein PelE